MRTDKQTEKGDVMAKISRKLIGSIIIGIVLLYPVIFSAARAQQTVVQKTVVEKTTAGAYSGPSIDQLKSRKTAIASMADIDAKVKTDAVNYIQRAISFLELYESIGNNAKELSQLVRSAPKRVKALQEELTQTYTREDKAQSPFQHKGMQDLEQQVRRIEAELASAQTGLKNWSDRLTAEKGAIRQIPEITINSTERQKEIRLQLEGAVSVAETDVLDHARMLFINAEQVKINAEINYNEQRQRSHNLLIELFNAELTLAQKRVDSLEQQLNNLQVYVQDLRRQEAVQVRIDAQDAVLKIPLQPKKIQDQFDINIKLSAELETITADEIKLAEKYSQYKSELKILEEEFATARKRVDLGLLNEVIGLALRTQRLSLPAIDQYLVDSKSFRIRMNEISEWQIKLDRLMRELANPKALLDETMGSMSTISDEERKVLESKIQEVLNRRLDIIQKSKSVYDRTIKLIQDIEFTKKQLVNTAEDFGELLDRHLLWIRSSKPFRISDAQHFTMSVEWFLQPENWIHLLQDITISFTRSPVFWISGIIVFLALSFSRPWTKKHLRIIAARLDQQTDDSFWLTIKTLGLTVILAAAWPYILWFPAMQLTGLPGADQFTTGIASGLTYASYILLFWLLFYMVCSPYGLAQKHFQWPEVIRKTLKNNLIWLIPIETVSSFFLGAMEAIPEFQYSDSLAKLFIIVQALAVSTFAVRILRIKGGISSLAMATKPDSWFCRLRYLWLPLAMLLPLFILFLTVFGYYYSALEIRSLMYNSIGLILTLIILNNMALRALRLARRKIIVKNKAAQQMHKETVSPEKSGSDSANESQPPLMGTIVEMDEIDEQTRSLLKLSIFVIGLLGAKEIWEQVFPAFGILQDIQFWSYTAVVDGVEKMVPITLASIIIAIIVVAATIIAVRNLPGLLEMLLLNRLPMDPGARYAYSTVLRYAITALGIFITLNTIGVRWEKLQWLVAALSVGIGFGLQEIVANFISGLIVLFERPFRIGDTVTIGQVSGTVKRIQIRATTIEDWDRKELIVPNKDFITGTLLNWTLSDQIIRIKIPVGIAYGSDTDLAEKLMLKAAKNNPLVLKSPPARAVFLGFGDNSLNFEVRIFIGKFDDYIQMLHQMNRTIDQEFRKNGITIAFPQRDLHFDKRPIDIRLVSGEASIPVVDES